MLVTLTNKTLSCALLLNAVTARSYIFFLNSQLQMLITLMNKTLLDALLLNAVTA